MREEAPGRSNSVFAGVLAALIAADLLLGAAGVLHDPPVWGQPGFSRFAAELPCVLLVYAVILGFLARRRGSEWNQARLLAWRFGLASGAVEILDSVLEDDAKAPHGGWIALSFMFTVFALWGVAAGLGARRTGSVRSGLLAAVVAAGICMLVAVGAGFVLEFFVKPPDLRAVATWAEFQRSGWSDARAFAVANTLDSGFTHLAVAPLVALVFGAVGSIVGVLRNKAARVPA